LAEAGHAVALLLDANQRVVQRHEDPTAGLAALARLRADAPSAGRPAQPPPVLLIPDVLDATQCRAMIDLWRTRQEEGAVGTTGADGRSLNRAKETRRCRDHTILDPRLNRVIGQTIARRIAPEVAKAFAFRLTNAENYYVVGYEATRGDFFRPHRDNANPAFGHRRFAMTLSLNAGDYTGGGVRFPEYDPAPIDPPRGGAVVFSCSLLHEAVEVEAGTRFILSNFFWGSAEEAQRKAYGERVGGGR
jgi:predicted 2-oxoglutarate/Fe(II)-dependent dioxygenase YbiX